MEWNIFFLVVTGSYAAYYVLNIAYDVFASRKSRPLASASVVYNMDELLEEQEPPRQVEEPYQEEPDDVDEYDEEDPDDEVDYDQEESDAAQEFPLRVEGQGIPLDDFLREARNHSNAIF